MAEHHFEEAVNSGGFLCGSPAQIVEHLKKLEERYPGLDRISVSLSVGVPQSVALEQLERFGTEVMPAFARGAVAEPALARLSISCDTREDHMPKVVLAACRAESGGKRCGPGGPY